MARRKFSTYYADRAWLDSAACVVLCVASALTLRILGLSIDASAQTAFLTALTTVSGLVLTASVFVCTMVIQSPSVHLRRIRSLYPQTFSAVWIHILSAALLSCALAALLLLAPPSPLVISVGIGLLVLALASGFRTIWWLKRLLAVEEVERRIPSTYVFPEAHEQSN